MREVVRVDRDAVPADARTRSEGLEAERLGLGAVDDVPDVDPQLVAEARHLVDQGDVDVPVGVLEQLGHLRLAQAARDDDGVDEGRRRTRPRRPRSAASGRRRPWAWSPGRKCAVAGVDALGAEGEPKSTPATSPLGSRIGPNDLLGRARVGRRLQHDEAAGSKDAQADGGGGRLDEGKVGSAVAGEGSGHADHEDVGPRPARRDGRRRQERPVTCASTPELRVGDVVETCERPAASASIVAPSVSKPTTSWPAARHARTSGRPT